MLLVAFCLIGIIYIVYHQTIYIPAKIKRCNDIAVAFEKARHAPIDDLQITNQDIASYMKNFANCYAE